MVSLYEMALAIASVITLTSWEIYYGMRFPLVPIFAVIVGDARGKVSPLISRRLVLSGGYIRQGKISVLLSQDANLYYRLDVNDKPLRYAIEDSLLVADISAQNVIMGLALTLHCRRTSGLPVGKCEGQMQVRSELHLAPPVVVVNQYWDGQ